MAVRHVSGAAYGFCSRGREKFGKSFVSHSRSRVSFARLEGGAKWHDVIGENGGGKIPTLLN